VTFSIVAADETTGEVGCAVASKYLAIGAVTPWVRAGVGAVATQAMGVVAGNGERVLTAIAAGFDPAGAIKSTLAIDVDAEIRQLGVVTADGRTAAYSGAGCVDWVGHITEAGLSVQGNMLVDEGVLVAMRDAFLATRGHLPERLMEALEAGQAAGGDRRGQQAAALIVEQDGAAKWSRERVDRVCDLRVDDDPQAVGELSRLFALWAQRQCERYP
jgi:uncharacterized Ntn-hydrolase superfamily protein